MVFCYKLVKFDWLGEERLTIVETAKLFILYSIRESSVIKETATGIYHDK